MTREPYTYSILRYRHDPVAGEQVNVGVVLYASKSGFLSAEIRKAFGRVSKMFPNVDSTLLKNDLSRIERAFQKLSKTDGHDLFSSSHNVMNFAHRIVGADDGPLMWSEMGSGVTSDPAKTLSDLYFRFVSQYDENVSHRRNDADVWKPFRDRLLERQIGGIFEKKVIHSPRNEVEFEHAWKNGVWHCIQPLSFDLVTVDGIQEKAARWVGQMVGLSKADEVFKPYFLIGSPTDESMAPAFQRAVEFLRDAPLDPQIVLETEMDNFADALLDKVRHSERTHVTN